jgi:hypothetical protein
MLSPRRKTALIAGGLFLVLGALAIHASPLSAGSLEARLQTSAERALRSIDADRWASVSLDGQVATVTGLAPDRAAQAAALEAVARSSWAGGQVAGGLTEVIDRTREPHEGALVQFSADKIAGRVSVRGFAPDATSVETITALADQLFGAQADVDLRLAPGASPVGFEAVVRLVLSQMEGLDSGAARISGSHFVVTGLAPDSAAAIRARQAITRGGGTYSGAALIRTDAGRYGVTLDDPLHCRLAIDAASGSRPVAFTPGGDALTAASLSNLRLAGAAFNTCSSGPLIVAVRAEGDGPDAEALALARAEAVIAAMAAGGPDRERFLAESAPADTDRALRFELAAPAATPTPSEQTEE